MPINFINLEDGKIPKGLRHNVIRDWMTVSDGAPLSVTQGDVEAGLVTQDDGAVLSPDQVIESVEVAMTRDDVNSELLSLAGEFVKEAVEPLYWDPVRLSWFVRSPRGLWYKIAENVLVHRVFHWLLSGGSSHLVEEKKIQRIIFNIRNLRFKILVEPKALLFDNGVYYLEERRFDPGVPEDLFFTWKLPFAYQPGLSLTPVQTNWLDHVTGGDVKGREIVRLFLAQVLGLAPNLQIIFFVAGEPGTGKSTLFNIAVGLVGPDNAVGTSIAYFDKWGPKKDKTQ